MILSFFFFQAEDGIRDRTVTGVQTCALPICRGKSERVILIRAETSPDDIAGMSSARGILTATGGMTSHAAVVARGMGKCCVAGCTALSIDEGRRGLRVGGRTLRQGAVVWLGGSQGGG